MAVASAQWSFLVPDIFRTATYELSRCQVCSLLRCGAPPRCIPRFECMCQTLLRPVVRKYQFYLLLHHAGESVRRGDYTSTTDRAAEEKRGARQKKPENTYTRDEVPGTRHPYKSVTAGTTTVNCSITYHTAEDRECGYST